MYKSTGRAVAPLAMIIVLTLGFTNYSGSLQFFKQAEAIQSNLPVPALRQNVLAKKLFNYSPVSFIEMLGKNWLIYYLYIHR